MDWKKMRLPAVLVLGASCLAVGCGQNTKSDTQAMVMVTAIDVIVTHTLFRLQIHRGCSQS
jgi:hypothetical protein